MLKKKILSKTNHGEYDKNGRGQMVQQAELPNRAENQGTRPEFDANQ